MAAASSRHVQRELSDIVECSVCCETYNDPRQLPCIHSYCLKCIREYCRNKCPGDAVACPLCRKEFDLPEDGVVGLPKNFFLEQLKELADPSSTHCDVCGLSATDAAMRKLAKKFCMDCNERLCETCAEIHGRMRATKGHDLVKTDGDDESSESRVRLMRVYCDKHQEKVLELFCFDCKIAICMMCFVKSHKPHECSEMNEVAAEFRRQITGDIENMADTVSRCREVVEGVKKKKDEFNNKVKKIEREICQRTDKLKQLIDQEKSNLLKELESLQEERNKQIDNVVDEMEQHVSFVTSLRTYIKQLRDKGRSSDVTQQMSNLQNRADELMKLDAIQQAINELGFVDVSFTCATWPTSNVNALGKISKNHVADNSSDDQRLSIATKVQRPQQMTAPLTVDGDCCLPGGFPSPSKTPCASVLNGDSSLAAPKVVSTLSQIQCSQRMNPKITAGTYLSQVIYSRDRGWVAGVTLCNKKLFVLRKMSEQRIEQYDMKSVKELEAIRVKGLCDDDWWWCKSLTSCCINNCLYLNDQLTVFRVDLSTKAVISWRVPGCPRGLSVNKTGNVLVTCFNGNEIIEYSTSGSLVRSIQLQVNHVTRPLHTVQLTDGRYVVCHLGPVAGISMIDQHGTLITSYRNSETTRLVDYPRWIVVVNDCILVADVNNNRILSLNSSMNVACELSLTVKCRLNEPWCMYFDQSSSRLFVGEWGGKHRVLVFGNIQLT